MKKLRGVKRYFRRLYREIEAFDLMANDWYDFWHEHPDFHGYGNISGRYRREHLKVGLRLFESIQKQAQAYPHPLQSWLVFDKNDSSQDSVYIHTENPQKNFPYEFEEIIWVTEVPGLLQGIVEENQFEFGYMKKYPANIWARKVENHS